MKNARETKSQGFSPDALVSLLKAHVRSVLVGAPVVPDRFYLRRMLTLFVFLRVTILTSFLGASAWKLFTSGGAAEKQQLLFGFIAGLFAFSAINALVVRRTSMSLVILGCVQLAVDVLLVTAAVALTGSAATNLLYLLVILGAAILFQRHGAVITASLSAVCYTLLESGMVPGVPGRQLGTSPHEILAVYGTFIIIAFVSSYLAEQLLLLKRLTSQQAHDISEMTKQQQALFDDISEGIISLDLNSTVTAMNQAARAIMGLSQIGVSTFVGKPLSFVFDEAGLPGTERILKVDTGKERTEEVVLKDPQGGPEIHLNYVIRPIRNSEGLETGRLLIFSDMSKVRSMEEKLELHEKMTELFATESTSSFTAPISGRDVFMVGESPIMKQVVALVERIAQSEASVLISGESGTGKELIARAIHARGPRGSGSFVAINCGAIPENLIESELFGHKKGSFTGAVTDNPGLFRQANGGTIFLDEIGELPLPMQTKLLRVLQERKVRAVGDVHDIPVDVRVVAATNRDLKREISAARFREDLFYRLNVVNVVVPPLRERREDIPLLVRHFVGTHCDPDSIVPRISPEAIQLLMNYNFPGNIRELENVIERALVLGGQAILPEHLPEEVRSARVIERPRIEEPGFKTTILSLPVDLDAELSKLEKELLFRALEQTGGVKKQAAELLGLNFRSLRYRLKKYGVDDQNAADE